MTVVPLKRLCSLPPEYGLNITPERYRDEGVRLLRTSDITPGGGVRDAGGVFLDAEDVPAEMLLRDGDLLFSRSGTLGRALLHNHDQHGEATFAGFLVRFRLRRGIEPQAIRYWSESAPFVGTVASEAIQSTISNFNADRYANLSVPSWLVEHSAAIADFLDAETAQIDGLVSARQRTLLLLNERLEAAIRSRIPPVDGESGSHASRVREVAALVNGFPFDSQLFLPTGEIPLVRIRDLLAGEFSTFLNNPVPPQAVIRDGDVLIGMDGDFNVVLWARGPAALNQRLCALRTLRGHDPRYLAFALRHPLRTINDLTFSTTVKHLSSTDVLRCCIPKATADEQRAVADELDTLAGVIDRAEEGVRRQIQLLLERRQALITAAVTGQLEIPGVAA